MSAEDQIRQYAERIVRLEEERRALASDIKDTKAEAKAAGFSPKLIAKCVAIMLMEAEKRAAALGDHEELDLYLGAVGLIARREVEETRQDAGGSRYAGSAMAARAAACDTAEADVVRETVPSVSAPDSRVWHGAADGAPRLESECGSKPRPAPVSPAGASDLDPSELYGEPRSRIHPLPATGREEGRHLHSDRSS
jgi:uncharacterized protein (UPF0335 family)